MSKYNSKVYCLHPKEEKNLDVASKLLNKGTLDILEEALQEYLKPFLDAEGDLKFQNVYYYSENGEKKECKYIGDCIINNQKFRKVIVDGEVKQLPETTKLEILEGDRTGGD